VAKRKEEVDLKKKYKEYNTKMIETPTTLEIWEYLSEPIIYSISEDKEINSKKGDLEIVSEEKKTNIKQEYDAIKRKQKHYEQMRWEISRIIDCNFDDNTKFMTLTFKDNIQDVKYTNVEFKKFIKRLNYYLYNEKKQNLKYLAVWEKQKRGAIHYHIIFFGFPFINLDDLNKIWGNGFVKINKIDVDSKDNRGRYVSKYFTKDIDDKDYKQKAFFKSQNLKKPIVTRKNVEKWYDITNKNVVYTKLYSRTIPVLYGLNTGKYKESFVRYIRIKKA